MESAIIMFVFLSVVVGGYLLPSIIACFRHHPNGAAIFVLNAFAGWSFGGWLIALVWAVIHFRADSA
ncbi:MAG: superinfection immunity protein [Rhodospirillaceae bacterium]|nr:MAG: superinfection immunity protein [Rhodospirillaceae bacterium]